jgi:hypothetical protein
MKPGVRHKPMTARILLTLVVGVALLSLAVRWRSSAPQTGPPPPPAVSLPPATTGGELARRPPAPTPVVVTLPGGSAPRELNFDDEPPSIPVEAIERYLERNGRDAASLLAAAAVAEGGEAYLREAAERFPDDPRVQWTVLYKNLFPERRRAWLDRFMQSAPEDCLPAYVSARDRFKAGDTAGAVGDLLEANRRPGFDDYTLATIQDVEEAYIESGVSVVQAKLGAFGKAPMPHLVQFKQLGQEMVALREQYLAAGDVASARAMEQMTLGLADRLTTGEGDRFLIGQLVGVAIERQLLDQLPPDGGSELLGMTAAQRAEELSAWKTALKSSLPDIELLLRQASEAEAISYFDRLKTVGELEAMRWWQNRRGQP